jgi:cyclic-di-GMP-binding protein
MNIENYPMALKNRKTVGSGYWQFECMRLASKSKAKKATTSFNLKV